MTKFLIALVIAICGSTALAQTYPDRPIHLVVPFPPGGGSDAIARAISTKLGETLGQTVVVDNRPGAGGVLASQFVAAAPGDGYTLLLADTPFVTNLSVYSRPGYSLSSFAPIGLVAAVPSFLVVGQRVPASSVTELIALAKSKPNQLNMASGGAGGIAHLVGARFAAATGISWTHVPYRGMGPAMLDVVGGQADVMFASAPTVLPQMKSGRIKILAATSSKRSAFLPEVPTLGELGYRGLTFDNWYGIAAPAKTSDAIRRKLLDSLNAAVRSPEVRAALRAQMSDPLTSATSQEFANFMSAQATTWSIVVKAAQITAN